MVSFGTETKGLSVFLSKFLPQLLIFKKVSPFKVAADNVHMVFAWNMYPLDGKNIVRYLSKKGERFLFPHRLSLEQLPILQLNKDDKRNHHRIFKNLHCTMKKFDVVG